MRRSSSAPLLAQRHLEVGDVLESLPHLACVVVAEVVLNLPLVRYLGFSDASLQVGSGCAILYSIPRPESDIVLPQQYLDLFSHTGFLFGIRPETFVSREVVNAEVDVGKHRYGVLLQVWVFKHVYMFMHLADAFIQSDLQVGRVRGSCLRTPSGGITVHAGDLNPGLPHKRWQSYHYTIQSNLCSQNSPAAGVMHPLAMFLQSLWGPLYGGALLLRGVYAGISSMDMRSDRPRSGPAL